MLKYGEPEVAFGDLAPMGGKSGMRARRRRKVLEFMLLCQELSSKAFARGHVEVGLQYQQRAISFTHDEQERLRLSNLYGDDVLESIDEKLRSTRSVDSRLGSREAKIRQSMLMAAETKKTKRKRLFSDAPSPGAPAPRPLAPGRQSAKSRQRAARRKRQRLQLQQGGASASSSTPTSKPKGGKNKPNPNHANLTCHKCGKKGHIAPNCPGK